MHLLHAPQETLADKLELSSLHFLFSNHTKGQTNAQAAPRGSY